jgi:hypothetical protein
MALPLSCGEGAGGRGWAGVHKKRRNPKLEKFMTSASAEIADLKNI